ncbi:hypothetical protein GJR96_09685 [Haloferax sp. MBLA0076]|uniref:Uncharacterized protein n=1 Tax=Haloferax litoreum TaxID=2666140 RepID=A0A6A8GGC7_9EURY|nr:MULTISPECIES: hypothetical protein [Haloferax]KAB1193693.1 hypothetical protein Hfx1148_09665 [Haloferax sp. CBA1148]MRX22223.1 hypothetical protein [Haloferax litoreum]
MATTEAVEITDWNFERGTDGNVVAVVQLRNTGDGDEKRTVKAVAKSGDKRQEKTEQAVVSPGLPKTVKIPFEITHEQFRKSGDLTVDLE